MRKKTILSGITVVVIIAASAFYWNAKYQKKKADAIQEIGALSSQATPLRPELAGMYQKRYEILLTWQKAAGGKLPPEIQQPIHTELNTEQDLANFDHYQLLVSNQLSTLLNRPELKKKAKELEMLEHQINKKRASYDELGFKANSLIREFKTEHATIPLFPAEKMLHEMKK